MYDESSDRLSSHRKSSSLPFALTSPRKTSLNKMVHPLASKLAKIRSPDVSPNISPTNTPPESPNSSPRRERGWSMGRSSSKPRSNDKKTRADIYEEVVNLNHSMQSVVIRIHDMEKLATHIVKESEQRIKTKDTTLLQTNIEDDACFIRIEEEDSSCIQCYNKGCIIQ